MIIVKVLGLTYFLVFSEVVSLEEKPSRMGYDVSRFEGSVDEELICTICSAVLEDPRLAPE